MLAPWPLATVLLFPTKTMRLVFLGPPGSGKSTQAQAGAARWQIPSISTGDLLRDAIATQSDLGKQAQTHVEAGELVPDTLMVGLMRESFGSPATQNGWILDGFPRNLAQTQALDTLLQIMGQLYGQVVYFETPEDLLIERMLKRGRQDDSEDLIRQRLQIYNDQTTPLIDFYRRRQCLIEIDGSRPESEITDEIASALQPLVSV
ncbi:adenylate kinase [Acaryochloris marina MBIC10699]|nr:adenylate kinase [Acaryochloris marina MBIC10699]